jgi:hypothetical protein
MLAYLEGVTPKDMAAMFFTDTQEESENIVTTSRTIKLLLKIAEKLDNMGKYKSADALMQKVQKKFKF